MLLNCKRDRIFQSIVGLAFLLGTSYLQAADQERAEVFVQLGHRSAVTSVAIRSDGLRVASSSLDGTVKLWDPLSGRVLKTFEGHQGSALAVAFSPDGKTLASVGRDRTLRLWDAEAGTQLRQVVAHDNIVLAVAFAPDGKRLVTASYDRTVKFWDPVNAKDVGSLETQSAPIRTLSFSRQGDQIALGSEDGSVRVYKYPSGTRIADLQGHRNGVLGVAFSPTGNEIASAGQDGSVRIWDLTTGREITQVSANPGVAGLTAHQGAATGVAYSADGHWLASSGQDGLVRLWNAATGAPGQILRAHAGEVSALAFSSTTPMLVSAGIDRTLRIWDIGSKDDSVSIERLALRSRVTEVRAVALSASGGTIAVAGNDGQVRIWDAVSGRMLRALVGHQGAVEALRFSPDGRVLATGGQDRIVRLWDWSRGTELRALSGHRGAVLALAFSPDGRSLATGSFDASIRLWETESGAMQRELVGHRSSVRSLDFSPNGNLLASGSYDDTVRLWDTQAGTPLKTFKDHTNRVTSVAFSPDGKLLVSGGEDSTVRVRELARDDPARKLSGHAGPVRGVAFTSATTIASVSIDGTVALWDATKGARLGSSALAAGQLYTLGQAGSLLVSGGDSGAVTVLSISDARERARLFSFLDGNWVSVTPEGYFHSSEGGARYLSVRMNTEVHSLEQFSESFYSPARIQLALAGQTLPPSVNTKIENVDQLREAVARASIQTQRMTQVKLAPKIAIVEVPREVFAGELAVNLSITDAGGGIGDVRLYLNGAAIVLESTRNLAVRTSPAGTKYTYKVRLVNGRNTLRAIAFNSDNNMQSEDAVQEIVAKFTTERKPSVQALVVGIEKFSNPRLNLSFSVADAKLFADVLKEKSQGLFETVNLKLLTTAKETTRESVIAALREIQAQVNPEDLFVFYVASHGTVDDGEYFLITSNVGATSTDRLKSDAISQTTLKGLLGNMSATKKFVVLDTCNAGQLGDAIQTAFLSRGLSEDKAAKMLSRSVGSTVLSAATSQQEALEGYKGHGLFTWVVVEGLRGKADTDRDGFIKTTEIADYVDNEVPELADRVFHRRQYPVTSPTGQQFPLMRASTQ